MKNTITTITCDGCGNDISPEHTTYPHKYILKICCQDVALRSERGAVYAIYMSPPIKDDLYFCGMKCIKKYVTEKIDAN